MEGPSCQRRRPLPQILYSQHVAPFLQIHGPLPNMLYAIGGRNHQQGPLDVVEMFDTWNGHWVTCPSMPTRRAGSAAAALGNGSILVVGGYDEKGEIEGLLASSELYNPYRREWTEVASLTRARWGHGCATLGSKVFVVGGCSLQPGAQPLLMFMETIRSCELYDVAAGKWARCGSLHVARSGSRVVNLGDRYLAVAGGCDERYGRLDARLETQPTVELYEPDKDFWSLLGCRLTHPTLTAGVAVLDDRQILVVGGNPALSFVETYSVPLPGEGVFAASVGESENCRKLSYMMEGRMGSQAAAMMLPSPGGSYPMCDRRCMILIGGERYDKDAVDVQRIEQFCTVLAYDIQSGAWLEHYSFPSMPAERTAVSLCVGVGTPANA